MAFGIDTIIARIEWLERHLRGLFRALEDLRDQVGAIRMREPGRDDDRNREGEIVIVRPTETIGMASFTEAVTGPPYQEARIVPDSGQARVWYSPTLGDFRARDTVRRWDPDPLPGAFIDVDARVTIYNINPSQEIPSTARYVVCVRWQGLWVAATWECDPT
jgi:hypothetical protein